MGEERGRYREISMERKDRKVSVNKRERKKVPL